MYTENFVLCMLAFFLPNAAGDFCEVQYIGLNDTATTAGSSAPENDTSAPTTVIINCPRPGDPSHYTFCCYGIVDDNVTDSMSNGVEVTRCCPPPETPSLFPFVSDKVALIIAITITSILTFLTVGIVFCCFSPRCPLYMACRVRYRQDDIIAYASKDEETANLNDMPPEEQKGVKIYSPNAVKVTKTCDD